MNAKQNEHPTVTAIREHQVANALSEIQPHADKQLNPEKIAAALVAWSNAKQARSLIPLLAQVTKEIFELTGGEGAGGAAHSSVASPDGPPPSVLGHVTIVSIEASPEPPLVILGNRGYETKIGGVL